MDIKSKYINLIAVFILILIFFLGLGLGLLIRPDNPTPIIIDKNVKIGLPKRPAELSENSGKSLNFIGGNFVASINGKNYYPSDCPSAKRIKEENMIWFESAKEAEADGYAPAKNCP